ncbi:hypothetical protein AS9A_2658 [Hoyosella subflava DQS3-9A1]|uniref:Arylsulfotransferase n=2 Tax=Hoyosella TaxID=697025 RepID=F6EHC6_HOYSD|nr:hypothetical protein AS9A_2658 [Hoyosella subflava DQS3-9A1]
MPPEVATVFSMESATDGYILLVPRVRGDREEGDPHSGLLIIDTAGEPVWTRRFDGDIYANDLTLQTFRGEPVLTYWQGESFEPGWGEGEYIILNGRYEEVARVSMGDGLNADFHDLIITPRDTALMMAYPRTEGDPPIRSSAVQEVDIETGEVLFAWDALDHVDTDESDHPLPEDEERAWDYFHINSVDEDADGNLLISARHTHALYKIDRETGEIMWTLGGKNSDFTLGSGVEFRYQHDARWLPDGRISLLDNVSAEADDDGASRALILQLDEETMHVDLVAEMTNPDEVISSTQANHQVLPNGHSFVGWGSRPSLTEFGPDGKVKRHMVFPSNMFSYRALLGDWVGTPEYPPAVSATIRQSGTVSVAMSWNGATEVVRWRVLAGAEPDALDVIKAVPRDGFETETTIDGEPRFVRVQALDVTGEILTESEVLPVSSF